VYGLKLGLPNLQFEQAPY